MPNTNTDARHSISWHVCVALQSHLSYLNIYFKFRFSHVHIGSSHTGVLFINVRYKFVPPLTLSRQYLTRPAHPILAIHTVVRFRFDLQISRLCASVSIFFALVIQFETWKFLSHTFGNTSVENMSKPRNFG